MRALSVRSFAASATAALGLFAASESLAEVTLVPTTPKGHETVRIEVSAGVLQIPEQFDSRATEVSMSGNRVSVSVVSYRGAQPEPSGPLDIVLGQFPSGDYEYGVRVVNQEGVTLRMLAEGSFSIQPREREAPIFNLTDIWWDPAESGWGFNIIQHTSGTIFATWFVYDADGSPAWYVLPEGQWVADGAAYRGPLYRTAGPAVCYTNEPCHPFDPAAVTRTLVGEALISVNFSNYDEVLVTFRVNGRELHKRLRRQSF